MPNCKLNTIQLKFLIFSFFYYMLQLKSRGGGESMMFSFFICKFCSKKVVGDNASLQCYVPVICTRYAPEYSLDPNWTRQLIDSQKLWMRPFMARSPAFPFTHRLKYQSKGLNDLILWHRSMERGLNACFDICFVANTYIILWFEGFGKNVSN